MSAIKQMKKNNEETMKDKVMNSKPNKEKVKAEKTPCPCAVILTLANGIKNFEKGNPVFAIKQVIEKDGKEVIKDVLCTSCSRNCKDGELYCYSHSKADNDGKPVLKFDIIKDDPESRLIDSLDDEMFNKRKGKKATPKKNRLEINKRIVDDEDAYNEFIDRVKQIECEILQNMNKSLYGNSSQKKLSTIQKKSNPKPIHKEEVEEDEINDEVEEVINANDSDEEQYQSDDEEEFEEIETNDGRTFLKKENIIYSPEEKEEPFAELIEVQDQKAPFNLKEDEYYIAGTIITIEDTEYLMCKITDNIYDTDSLDKIGKAKKNKKGVITGIKKST